MPQASGAREEKFDLPRPLPVYMTYLTVEPDGAGGLRFLPDVYGWDSLAMPQMFGGASQVASAD
jgi:murein L,D-transpeptidase YcbB/YkuD